MLILIVLILSSFVSISQCSKNQKKICIVGRLSTKYGIGTIAPQIINSLKNDFDIYHIDPRPQDFFIEGIDFNKKILKKPKVNEKLDCAIFTDVIFNNIKEQNYKFMPKNSKINIAYSMIESTMLPTEWVNILNNYFDHVIVPCNYLKKMYTESGVTKNIDVLPLPLSVKGFNNIHSKKRDKFTFISVGGFGQRKNHTKLALAFKNKFNNSDSVQLIIHSNLAFENEFHELKKYCQEIGVTNVLISNNNLKRKDYLNLLSSCHVFVSISTGEGYGIPAREAMMLGLPSVLTKNTAYLDLIKNNSVVAVDSNILEPALYESIENRIFGYQFQCRVEDVENALTEIYDNYEKYNFLAIQNTKNLREFHSFYLNNLVLNFIKKICFEQKK